MVLKTFGWSFAVSVIGLAAAFWCGLVTIGVHIPEVATGLIGAGFIAAAVRHEKQAADSAISSTVHVG